MNANIVKEAETMVCGMNNYEDLKPHLYVRLIDTSYDKSAKDLLTTPIAGNLAECYGMMLEMPHGKVYTPVRKEVVTEFMVDPETIRCDAIENTTRIMEPMIGSLTEILGFEGSDAPPIWVVGTSEIHHGSGIILTPGVLDQLTEELGGDFFILPSSIHEVLCVPAEISEWDQLLQMVQTINDAQVAPRDRLSYDVFCYHKSTKTIEALKH